MQSLSVVRWHPWPGNTHTHTHTHTLLLVPCRGRQAGRQQAAAAALLHLLPLDWLAYTSGGSHWSHKLVQAGTQTFYLVYGLIRGRNLQPIGPLNRAISLVSRTNQSRRTGEAFPPPPPPPGNPLRPFWTSCESYSFTIHWARRLTAIDRASTKRGGDMTCVKHTHADMVWFF